MPIFGIMALVGIASWIAGGVTGYQARQVIAEPKIDHGTGLPAQTPIDRAAGNFGKAAGNGLAIAAVLAVGYVIFVNETKRRSR